MKISVIIPNYNGSNLLQKNLPVVLSALEKHKDSEVIVVDDASTDESVAVLAEFKDKIILIQNSTNKGFAEAVNKGVREAHGDIIVLLNSDVRPKENFLDPLLVHFKDEKVFAAGCMNESMENGKIVDRGRGIGKWSKGFLIHAAGSLGKDNTLWADGGSSAFRKNIWDDLGGFSTLYKPFYWEDIDLSYRAWKHGYEIKFEHESIVVHEHEQGAIKKNFSPFYVKTTAYKNQFIFVWKNIRDLEFIISHILWLPYHFLRALMYFDFAFFLGFLRALFLVPQIIQSSIVLGGKFVKSDKEILLQFHS